MIDRSIFKYIVVGVSSSVIFLILLILQVEIFTFDPVIAAVFSNLIVIFIGYLATYNWVFESNENHRQTFIRYISVIGLGFLINTLGMYSAVHIFEFWYLASQIVLFIIVAINNYSLNRYWAFKSVSNL